MGQHRWWTKQPPQIKEVRCKSLLHSFTAQGSKGSLTINPYSGCAHRCVYCYATYEWFPEFFDTVSVKRNAPEVLDDELRKWKGGYIAPVFIASATDCYQPAEGMFRLTRGCIEALQKHGVPYYIFTKSSSIVRDLDLHARYRDKCLLVWSITTLDERTKRMLEPSASSAKGMLKAIERASKLGITTAVNVDPIIPGLTDEPEGLRALVSECSRRGTKYISASVLRLREDIWKRLKSLLLSASRLDVVSKVEGLYFSQPLLRDGYYLVEPKYEQRIVSTVKRYAEDSGLVFGLPIEETPEPGSPPCGSFALKPKRLWSQTLLLDFAPQPAK